MSDLIAAAIKIVFLALLWVFIGIIADVVRKDLFGRKVKVTDLPPSEPAPTRRGGAGRVPTRFAITQGAQQGLSVPITATINLGRTADSTILLDDDYASSRHAQLNQRDAETWIVTDLGSTNGTYLNGKRLTEPTPMTVDDILRIGRTMMRLEV
ncbi:FHA domain-containing protein [Arachnia propionica]|uniref:FHA domain-containing protein n=1 Tax=Arachnia propionica TaxID=1750 RepID=A0A3P1T263_9ACTN|nr:FHA domain-containing protein [Arachnia propionica]MDO5084163.1 FHA domain-containing protein [Arachnia propionica]RRD03587.1 FHA domain-containing protein [Arachnia propionica]